jgi:hypothetical protein
MAGRPRTMLKRVTRILERHEKLAAELRELMPNQYLPGPGEGWDYPGNLEEWGDDLMRSWRKAVLEIGGVGEYLEDLVFLLELKVGKIEQNASLEADAVGGPDDDVDQPKSPTDCADCGSSDVSNTPNGEGKLAEPDTVQGAAS